MAKKLYTLRKITIKTVRGHYDNYKIHNITMYLILNRKKTLLKNNNINKLHELINKFKNPVKQYMDTKGKEATRY